MKNFELKAILNQYPDDMDIKLMPNRGLIESKPIDFTDENILHTSETAHVNPDAPEDEHDHEDGKIELGDGKQYLLINPIIY